MGRVESQAVGNCLGRAMNQTREESSSAADLLTVEEIATILRVPKSWVYERTRRRGLERLPHLKLGKYLRFRLCEVEGFPEKLRRA